MRRHLEAVLGGSGEGTLVTGERFARVVGLQVTLMQALTGKLLLTYTALVWHVSAMLLLMSNKHLSVDREKFTALLLFTK